MALVMLIDDDKEPMKYYVMALESEGHEVIQLFGPDETIEHLKEKDNPRPDVIILDIMMPPGRHYEGNAECKEGTRTGILVYPELSKWCPEVPVLVLTNHRGVQEHFRRITPRVPVLQKMDTAAFDLVGKVKGLLVL